MGYARGLDARDLDVYLYCTGVESLRVDGRCPVAEGDEVWWCYDGGDCVDPKQDWLLGRIIKCAPTDAIVRVENQLRHPKSHVPIPEQYLPVPLDRLRPDE